ncbi:MAG: HD domain-containing protein [Candidatus Kapaibacterium sp.]|nr:HD domain-containing protein [Bacteroidota bacterium]
MYNTTHLTQSEIEYLLHSKIDMVDMSRIMSAYEMAYNVHEQQVRKDGTPYFYHCTRVCKIIIEELKAFDADLICAALLHDVLEDSKTITSEIIKYNFGEYVSYVVETLTKDLQEQDRNPDKYDLSHVELLKRSSADCLIIRLAARLDNFRCLYYDLKSNPIKYINDTTERYIPLAEKSANNHLLYLVNELKKERNKFLG